MKWGLPLAACVLVGVYLVTAGAFVESGCRDGGPIEMADERAYRAEARVWRDEQPGDDPTLHFTVQLIPTGDMPLWRGASVTCVEIKAGDDAWTPRETSIELLGDDSFIVRGVGNPDLEAGKAAEITVKFATEDGDRSITGSVSHIHVFE